MRILLVGMSHKSAPVEIRERYAVEEVSSILSKLTAQDEIDEAVAISTCNRVEIIVSTRQMDAARHTLRRCFHADLGGGLALPGGSHLDDHVYEYFDQDAVTHVFRVASSIDSMVVGEPQILGQMKDAYREARDAGTCGPLLSRLYQRAFATAKRVKNETLIARRPVSVARVAVELTRQIFEDLRTKKALMIGAGEMIEASLFALRREGLGDCYVANRTRSNAQELADRFGASAHGLDELDELISSSDIVLSCIGSTDFVLDATRISLMLSERRRRPIFLIDMGVPRNIDPDVDSLENVYLYDIDDLQQVAQSNEAERQRESQDAERIVIEEQERFVGWMVALQSVPTIQHLRARAESIRLSELERALSRMDLDEIDREHVEGLTRSIVNKLLHPPLSRLKAQTDREEGLAVLEEARALFALDDATAPGSEIDSVYRDEGPEEDSVEDLDPYEREETE
ncbi:MAG: glutamyl-tRNA reductase [Myxococcota bacterium]|nr:glutamyl-tRNA reductase [Myxococcota bacterium]